jgi:hypothetical protein
MPKIAPWKTSQLETLLCQLTGSSLWPPRIFENKNPVGNPKQKCSVTCTKDFGEKFAQKSPYRDDLFCQKSLYLDNTFQLVSIFKFVE